MNIKTSLNELKLAWHWKTKFVLVGFVLVIFASMILHKVSSPSLRYAMHKGSFNNANPPKTGTKRKKNLRDPVRKPLSLEQIEGQDLRTKLVNAKELRGDEREYAVKHLLTVAALEDPEFVASELNTSGLSQIGMTQVATALMSYWPDPNKALYWAQSSLVGVLRASSVAAALRRVVAVSPAAALDFFNKMPPGSERTVAFASMVSAWAKSDVLAAMKFTMESGEPTDLPIAMNIIAKPWVINNPETAAEYLNKYQDDQRLSMLAHELAVAKVRENPSEALRWSVTMEGITGNRAQRSAVIAWAAKDAETVAKYISGSDEVTRLHLAPILANTWVEQDPVATAQWVGKLQDTGAQILAIEPLLYTWLSGAPFEAANWIENLPTGPTKDHARSILAEVEGNNRPNAAAVRWRSQQLEDRNLFSEVFETIDY